MTVKDLKNNLDELAELLWVDIRNSINTLECDRRLSWANVYTMIEYYEEEGKRQLIFDVLVFGSCKGRWHKERIRRILDNYFGQCVNKEKDEWEIIFLKTYTNYETIKRDLFKELPKDKGV